MTVPGKRRPSSAKRRRASHFALKKTQLIKHEGANIPHALKKAYSRTAKKTAVKKTKAAK